MPTQLYFCIDLYCVPYTPQNVDSVLIVCPEQGAIG